MRGFLVAFLIVSFFSCINKNDPPSGLLGRDSLRGVVWDMLLAEQYAKQYIAKDSSRNFRLETMKLYQEVFKLHHTNKEVFEKSFQFYNSRPDLAKNFFDSLSTYANSRRADLYKPKVIVQPAKK